MILKQMVLKYPCVRSALLDRDEDAYGEGFSDTSLLYKAHINDPAIAGASQSHGLFELVFIYNQWVKKQDKINFRLARSLLNNESLPNECLGISGVDLTKKVLEESKSSWE